jgi:carbon-monoxide dehydrogenase large subunit
MSARADLVGQPLLRIEDLRLLRGKGRYVDDIHREGMLHAAILRSSVAHGILKGIDTSEAKTLPGVHIVITSEDLGTVPHIPVRLFPNPDMEPFRQPVLAHG